MLSAGAAAGFAAVAGRRTALEKGAGAAGGLGFGLLLLGATREPGITLVADAVGLDSRIGRAYLDAGIGYGGGCLPKDTRAFAARAHELGVDCAADLLRAVDRINAGRRDRVVEMAGKACGGDVAGRRVGVWGAARRTSANPTWSSARL